MYTDGYGAVSCTYEATTALHLLSSFYSISVTLIGEFNYWNELLILVVHLK